ncbi:MAG TPA: alanine/ornithine racemase family PLP-dependent enzyme [Bacillota bacterium]|nr:alanine/ornithine racemase family PLP-dependent enzyme [Bacillota bacterium]
MYPRIIIDQNKLKENIERMIHMADVNNIPHITFVVKAFAGDKHIVDIAEKTDVDNIGDSRIENLKRFKDSSLKKMLLRIPMLSEIEDVIRYSDISLNSELVTIKALDKEAKTQNRIHEIILMFDLGDLREGIYYTSDYLNIVKDIIELRNIRLLGIGTNLTCYGGLVPNKKILNRLVEIKKNIENHLNIELKIISGGNSSSVTLFDRFVIPEEINHLRLGESILFGRETSYGAEIEGMHHDVFRFEAEIIELKNKPSYPDGEISINSFGEVPDIEDKGIMRRAILAIGKQDVILDHLFPLSNDIHVIGGSSDHLILELTSKNYKVGDVIPFAINYPALVHLMNSSYVSKEYK